MTDKDKKIIRDSAYNNIPIFVLTAKDKMAVETLIAYRDLCAADCSTEHFQGIEKRINEFTNWEVDNPDKMKIPD